MSHIDITSLTVHGDPAAAAARRRRQAPSPESVGGAPLLPAAADPVQNGRSGVWSWKSELSPI